MADKLCDPTFLPGRLPIAARRGVKGRPLLRGSCAHPAKPIRMQFRGSEIHGRPRHGPQHPGGRDQGHGLVFPIFNDLDKACDWVLQRTAPIAA
jgi:hypothetical protein